MSKLYEDIKTLRQEFAKISKPYEEKERELLNLLEKEEKQNRIDIFKKIEGKIFILKSNPYQGEGITMIKAISCDDFESLYNSCNVEEISLCWYKDGGIAVTSKVDTHRVSSLISEKEATKQEIEDFNNKITDFISIVFNKFKTF